MALNTAHSDSIRNGIILFTGERLLKEQEKVDLTFDISPKHEAFKGTKEGSVFLTNQRVIFLSSAKGDVAMKSFSMPFYYMKSVDIKQPVFGANAITGVIKSQPGGGWESHKQAEFKIVFKTGGAIEMGQLLLRVATQAPKVPPPRPGELPKPQPSASYNAGYPPPMPVAQYPPPMMGGGYAYPGQTVYPEYPPGAPLGEQPPPYSSVVPGAAPTAPPPPGPAYYSPNDPQYVYMAQTSPSTIPTAPPPEYTEKSKTD